MSNCNCPHALILKTIPKNFGGSTVFLRTLLRRTLSYTWLSALPIMPQLILLTQSLSEYRPGYDSSETDYNQCLVPTRAHTSSLVITYYRNATTY